MATVSARFSPRLSVWHRFLRCRRVLGLCQHPYLRCNTGLAGDHFNAGILQWARAFFWRATILFSALIESACWLASDSVCLIVGTVRMAQKLGTHRLSLGLCRLRRYRLSRERMGPVIRCLWLLLAIDCNGLHLGHAVTTPSRYLAVSISLGMTGLILLSGQLFTTVTWTKALGDPLTVAIVQPAVPLAKKWSRGHRRDILSDLALTTEPLYATHDLIVWPESALPGYRDQMRGFLTSIHTQAAAHDATVITGIPSRDNEGRYNSIEALGRGSGIYHKQKLVPFGEYIPFEPWLRGVIGFFDLPMSQFSPGPPGQAPLVIDDLAIAPFICYEIVYPDFVAASSKGSQLLVTISNDTWFGNSIGPWQHFQMARFRAVELGRDLIRGTNDGVSAIISAKGEVVSTAPQFTQAVVSGQVQPRSGHTPYAISGSLPMLIFSLIGLLLGRDPQ